MKTRLRNTDSCAGGTVGWILASWPSLPAASRPVRRKPGGAHAFLVGHASLAPAPSVSATAHDGHQRKPVGNWVAPVDERAARAVPLVFSSSLHRRDAFTMATSSWRLLPRCCVLRASHHADHESLSGPEIATWHSRGVLAKFGWRTTMIVGILGTARATPSSAFPANLRSSFCAGAPRHLLRRSSPTVLYLHRRPAFPKTCAPPPKGCSSAHSRPRDLARSALRPLLNPGSDGRHRHAAKTDRYQVFLVPVASPSPPPCSRRGVASPKEIPPPERRPAPLRAPDFPGERARPLWSPRPRGYDFQTRPRVTKPRATPAAWSPMLSS